MFYAGLSVSSLSVEGFDYPRKWAAYETARFGSLKLVPPDYRLPALKEDYGAMRTMFFGEIPAFDNVMDEIKRLESEINKRI